VGINVRKMVSFQKSRVAEVGRVNHVKEKDGFRQPAVRRGKSRWCEDRVAKMS